MPTSMTSAAFKDLFPVTGNLIYFNHAAVGPLSTTLPPYITSMRSTF